MRVVVAISGASGAVYGLRLLERLRGQLGHEIHLILTRAGEKTLFLETGRPGSDARNMADFSYQEEDISCRLASGSYRVDAMVVAPCSIHSMSAIATGISSNLLVRAADVALKERRRLILMVRETPFHLGHLRNMTALAEMGAIIAPPIPGFYNNPQTVAEIIDHSVDRVLDLLGLPDDQGAALAGSVQMKNLPVSFQGERGAFSEEAARRLVGPDVAVLPCARFEDVFRAVKEGRASGAIIPIENTLAGSVHENYDHLLHFDFPIVAETSIRIVHNLIAMQGVPFSKVRRVFSHPVALNQCLDFFAANPQIERTPFYDTAGSVKMVMEEGLKDAAGIASAVAAEIYGGRILRRSIESDRQNFTRFFLLRTAAYAKKNPLAAAGKSQWKTSLVFTTKNIPGALFRALSAFALRDLNLTKLESRPLRGKPYEYLFYLDFLERVDAPAAVNAINHLRELADFLRVLGCYPKGS